MRARVAQLAERRGYVPNRLARDLRRSGSGFVGFLVPNVRSFPYSIPVSECADLLGDVGYQLVLAHTDGDPAKERAQLRALIGAQVEGLLVVPAIGMLDESRQLISSVPALEFYRTVGAASTGVFVDDHDAIAAAVGHLADLGHRDIALVAATSKLSNARARLEGFTDGCRAHGITPRPQWTHHHGPPLRETGYDATVALLRGPEPPTALLVAGEEMSLGVAAALTDLEVRLPEQLSVVVFGEGEWTRLYRVPLTTVVVPFRRMACAMAEMMTSFLNGTAAPADTPPRVFVTELVVRASTAAPCRAAVR